jgi:hypothetical protein
MPVSLQLTLCGLVLALAAVQSVFGVGLLVFGTPALLLLGLPFPQVLAYLLPCSIVINALQVVDGGLTLEPIRKKLLLFTAPSVFIGALLILVVFKRNVNIRQVVGAVLIATAGIRLLGPLHQRMQAFAHSRLRLLLAILGLLHGTSNLGGGVLTLIVGCLYEDKASIRKHIAFGYGLMALIQITVLALTTTLHLEVVLWLTLPVLAVVSYAIVGKSMFRATGETAYKWSLTALIGIFGLLLFIRA